MKKKKEKGFGTVCHYCPLHLHAKPVFFTGDILYINLEISKHWNFEKLL